jgi:hypothetical protein
LLDHWQDLFFDGHVVMVSKNDMEISMNLSALKYQAHTHSWISIDKPWQDRFSYAFLYRRRSGDFRALSLLAGRLIAERKN